MELQIQKKQNARRRLLGKVKDVLDAEAAAGSNISLGCPVMAKDKSVEVLIRELHALQKQRDGPSAGSVPWQSLNCVCGFDASGNQFDQTLNSWENPVVSNGFWSLGCRWQAASEPRRLKSPLAVLRPSVCQL